MEHVILTLGSTGLHRNAQIVEIAAIKYFEHHYSDTYHSLVQPTVRVGPKVESITGLNRENLLRAPSFDQVVFELIPFLDEKQLVIFNARFTLRFLKRIYEAYGFDFYPSSLDLQKSAYSLLPELPNHQLVTVCKHFEIHRSFAVSFTALEKAKMLSKLYFKFEELKYLQFPKNRIEQGAFQFLNDPSLN